MDPQPGSRDSVSPPATDLRVSLNGGPYDQLFYGTQAEVNPSQRLYIKKLLKGQTLHFGGDDVVCSTLEQVVVFADGIPDKFSLIRTRIQPQFRLPGDERPHGEGALLMTFRHRRRSGERVPPRDAVG